MISKKTKRKIYKKLRLFKSRKLHGGSDGQISKRNREIYEEYAKQKITIYEDASGELFSKNQDEFEKELDEKEANLTQSLDTIDQLLEEILNTQPQETPDDDGLAILALVASNNDIKQRLAHSRMEIANIKSEFFRATNYQRHIFRTLIRTNSDIESIDCFKREHKKTRKNINHNITKGQRNLSTLPPELFSDLHEYLLGKRRNS
jgi:septal ring factor EnvC (AmiA/AmiB activator)